MKNLINVNVTIFALTLALLSPVYGADVTRAGVDVSASFVEAPIISAHCIAQGRLLGNPECIGASGAALISSALSSVLLKEIRAAQPDALEYAAGASPSPLLYSIVEKLQILAFETTGQKWSFDQIVNEMIINI